MIEDLLGVIKFRKGESLVLGDKESPVWFLETKGLQFGSWRQRVSNLVLGDKESPVWFLETKSLQFGSWRQRVSSLVLGEYLVIICVLKN